LKSLEAMKVTAEAESKRIRLLAGRASKELQQNKQLVETHKKRIEKLTAEKDSLAKLNKASVSMKEIDELKEKLTKLESERATEKIQLTGANEMNDKLRERLRQFQKTMTESKKKEAMLNSQLNEAKTKLNDVEAKLNVAEEKNEKPSQGQSSVAKESGAEPKGQMPDSSTAKTAATGDEVSKETPEETEKAAEKKQTKVVPKVPAGGFKFGPSADAEMPVSAPHQMAAAKASESKTHQVSKKRPIESIEEGNLSNKKPAPVLAKGKVTETAQSPGERAGDGEKDADGKGEATKPSPVLKRLSGENKEMSMKEKLLEKKRKLMNDLMKRKQDKLKKSQVKQEDETVSAEEPSAKRTKVTDDENPTEAVLTDDAAPAAIAEEVPDEASDSEQAKVPTSNEGRSEEGEMDETGIEEAGEASKEEETSATGTSKPDQTSTTGSLSASAPRAFGSGTAKPFVFGQSSGFGGGGTFGSSAAPTLLGKKPEASSASTSAFGGAFLDMKPPGNLTAPPLFSFGSSSSITLPTPSNPPQTDVFNAFSSPTQFNSGGVAAEPLFGSKKEEKKEPNKEDEEEEGEMEETEEK
jgi:hypothetical protein